MKRFFASKKAAAYTTQGGIWATASITAGTFGFFDTSNGAGNGILLPSNAAISAYTTPVTKFSFVGMPTVGAPIVIEGMDFASLRVTKKVYAAPTAKQVVLGSPATIYAGASLNLPSIIANGDTVGIWIIDLDKPIEDTTRMREYQFDVVDSDVMTGTGADNIIVKLAAKVTADTKKIVTTVTVETDGAGDANGITFSDTAGHNFMVRPMLGVLENATIGSYKTLNGAYDASFTEPTVYGEGSGTYAQMVIEENKASAQEGNINSLTDKLLWTYPSQLDPTINYTQYTFSWSAPTSSMMNTESFTQRFVLAVDENTGALISILDAMFAGKFIT
jgi:hypothetical protein